MPGNPLPFRQRVSHGNKLLGVYNHLFLEHKKNSTLPNFNRTGIFVDFIGSQNYELPIESLDTKSGIRLINIKNLNNTSYATIYLPLEKKDYFSQRINQYMLEDTPSNKPKHQKLIASIDNIKSSTALSFWGSDPRFIPTTKKIWCEIWLINNDDINDISVDLEFNQLAQLLHIEFKEESKLKFPERIIKLAKIDKNDIHNLINSCTCLAEIRPSVSLTSSWTEMEYSDQRDWSNELYDRTKINQNSKISICILDTGINNGHILLKDVLKETNKHSVYPSWGLHDHSGHGTNMSGLATYGCLTDQLLSNTDVIVNHNLASVKILPEFGETNENLWGDITSQAVSIREIEESEKKHIFCMAVTAVESNGTTHRGTPSSWSSEIDRLLYTELENNKLFIISAGNIDLNLAHTYKDINELSEIENPGQSWNALTIGSYTNKKQINDPSGEYAEYKQCIAEAGQISPFTRTSLLWDNQWPHKPDIVFEGGNLLINDYQFSTEHPDLSLLTTNWKPLDNVFTYFNQTSASTALASNFAAKLYSTFPHAKAETIRALMVHSARWTDQMIQQFTTAGLTDKEIYASLLRACGYGIPDFDKAINCYQNSLTLIAEDKLTPYIREDSRVQTNEMNFYELPWPTEELLSLGHTDIKMKVTLSYFIEPGPSELSNKKVNRYNYASHGLRFDLNHHNESKDEFRKRKNAYQREKDYKSTKLSASSNWLIGSTIRDRGNIISDTWIGKASDLATSNILCVYPIGGWWKTRDNLKLYNNEVTYSLIISIDTEEVNVDIYTPVKNKIEIPTEIII
jgi:hypothetical protein